MTKVAVVIPVWNRATTLGLAIQSALSQSPDELVVVDDASTDESVQVASQYPVRLIHHPRKTENHIEALGPAIASLTSDYVIGLGADDVLYDGFVRNVREVTDAKKVRGWPGVVFGDYDLLRAVSVLQVVETRRFGLPGVTSMKPAEARAWFKNRPALRLECGVGSAMRRDVLLWLYRQEFWRMGPYCDTLGSVVAACMHGCIYVPEVHAGFVVQQSTPSYHQQVLRSPEQNQKFVEEIQQWLSRTEIQDCIHEVQFAF